MEYTEYDPTTAYDLESLEELNYITTTETDGKEIPF